MFSISCQSPTNQQLILDGDFDDACRRRAALVISQRYALPLAIAALVAELAGIGHREAA